jgi:hypothetical protein
VGERIDRCAAARLHGASTTWRTPTGEYPQDAVAVEAALGERRSSRLDLTLVDLIVASLDRRHHKVALRRAFMLLASGGVLPTCLLASLEEAAQKCRELELQRMREAASNWSAMVGTRRTGEIGFRTGL